MDVLWIVCFVSYMNLLSRAAFFYLKRGIYLGIEMLVFLPTLGLRHFREVFFIYFIPSTFRHQTNLSLNERTITYGAIVLGITYKDMKQAKTACVQFVPRVSVS